MKLTYSLIEESLCKRFGSGHREVNLPCASHQVCLLTRAFIERFAMHGVTGQRVCCLKAPGEEGRKDEQAKRLHV